MDNDDGMVCETPFIFDGQNDYLVGNLLGIFRRRIVLSRKYVFPSVSRKEQRMLRMRQTINRL